MANSFCALAVGQLAMQADPLARCKFALFQLELSCEVEQAHLSLLLGKDFVEKCQMVAKEEHRTGIVDGSIASDKLIEEDRGHGSYVFVAEAQVGAGETGIARFDGGHTYWGALLARTGEGTRSAPFLQSVAQGRLRLRVVIADLLPRAQHMLREDLFGQGHRACSAGALARGADWRQKNFPLHARNIELKQAAVLYDLTRDLVFAGSELRKRDFFSGANFVDQRKICGSQNAQILAILLVNALNVFGNDELYARTKFGIRRLLAARSFTAALAADRSNESAALHVAALDRNFVATLQASIGKVAERLVEEEADVRGCNFIRRNVVTKLGIILRILRVPRQVFASELLFDQRGVFGEEQNAAF